MSNIKVSVKKNKQGGYTSTTRVYNEYGQVLSEHQATGKSAQEATGNALYVTEEYYGDNDPTFNIHTATIETSDNTNPVANRQYRSTAGTPTKEYDFEPMQITGIRPTTVDEPAETTTSPQTTTTPQLNPDEIDPTTGGLKEGAGPLGAEDGRWGWQARSGGGPKEKKISTTKAETPKPKFIKCKTSGQHYPWPDYDQKGENGSFGGILSEPIPKRFSRDGDCIINANTLKQGKDNNTMIVLGQDRSGAGEWNDPAGGVENPSSGNKASGYSRCMGAGAIDIVVGRGAPFPVPFEGLELGPLFLTKGSRQNPHQYLVNEKLQDKSGKKYDHPGFMMDAARIYISQMTDVDYNFQITRKINNTSDTSTKQPGSAIVLKSDRVRLHARNDIKIVTKGSKEKYTSTGLDIGEIGGIHLIAGNGAGPDQEPVVRGDRLLSCLRASKLESYKFMETVLKFVVTQMKFNKHIATHFHQSPAMGASTTPSIEAWASGVPTALDHYGNFVAMIPRHMSNLNRWQGRYLVKGRDPWYINSLYNTTN